MTVTVNHIVISGEVSDDQGTVKPVHLIFKKEDLAKAPGLIQDVFSLAMRYIYHQSNPPPDQHSLPSQGRDRERSS